MYLLFFLVGRWDHILCYYVFYWKNVFPKIKKKNISEENYASVAFMDYYLRFIIFLTFS